LACSISQIRRCTAKFGLIVDVDRAAVAAVAALDDDVRRALYQHIRDAGAPVTRESAAAAVGISRKLAAFHLDKLVELGVLRSGFGPATNRRVGRAPRLYGPGGVDIAVRVPERAPELLATILVEAVTEERADERGADAAMRVARQHGAAVGAQARLRSRPGRIGAERATSLTQEVLAEQGFEPYRAGAGVRLRNCPFHPLAGRAPEFVCSLNRQYLDGVLDGVGAAGRIVAELDPRPGECCVELRPT
jgi:predicted ArsR family transcriptional regulator